jgi:hypothetical protein
MAFYHAAGMTINRFPQSAGLFFSHSNRFQKKMIKPIDIQKTV